ncbi:hypothetical protein JTE90_009555 [Oedothorax gibbosus]|uniref:Uncharacterized protein n=1 Tax=Oedothorax gibbosus TaxID=931172 RepID=A0AAV6V1F6_9ARAC|nr:hypothetical protein JTE90_009555 [Oedothorax gibbosus]
MPKAKKNNDSKNKDKKQQLLPVEKGAVYCSTKNEIIIKVHAKPGAKESGITDISNEAVGVQISAPPVDGEANKELLRFLAEILNLKKSELSLEKGSRSKDKTVVICGTATTLDTVLTKLTDVSKQ